MMSGRPSAVTDASPLPLAEATYPGLASAWYVALPSDGLRRRPIALELFNERLVAWRGADGRPIVMSSRCPHQGADLALGTVIEDTVRCPFHHWRFDAMGTCVEASGAAQIPKTVRALRVYPTIELYGLIWVWYGTDSPAYDLPLFPPLESDGFPHRKYRFRYQTVASPRRVLENAFDPAHFRSVHGLPTSGPLAFTWLIDPDQAVQNGPPPPREAWAGARLEVPLRLPGARGSRLVTLLVDGWPGGQRLTFLDKGQPLAKELLAITPVRPGRTVFQGWSLVHRSPVLAGSAAAFWAYRYQHWLGTRQDLAIYRDAVETDGSVNEPNDQGVLRYRRYYREWVDHAHQDA